MLGSCLLRASLVCAGVAVAVIVVVGLKDLSTKLLLTSVDVGVQFVSVFKDGELLIVVNRDVNAACADWLVFWIVELGHIRMTQSLFGTQTSAWVELKQTSKKVECVVGGRWE